MKVLIRTWDFPFKTGKNTQGDICHDVPKVVLKVLGCDSTRRTRSLIVHYESTSHAFFVMTVIIIIAEYRSMKVTDHTRSIIIDWLLVTFLSRLPKRAMFVAVVAGTPEA